MATRVETVAGSGWVLFASAMLTLLGGMQVIAGLVGIFNSDFFVQTSAGLMVFNLTTWGWIHVVLGIISLLAAGGVLVGSVWARLYGIIVATLLMLGHVLFLTAYPLWSIVALIVNGMVIYALTLHGDEIVE
jgi:fatty acid desaturase